MDLLKDGETFIVQTTSPGEPLQASVWTQHTSWLRRSNPETVIQAGMATKICDPSQLPLRGNRLIGKLLRAVFQRTDRQRQAELFARLDKDCLPRKTNLALESLRCPETMFI